MRVLIKIIRNYPSWMVNGLINISYCFEGALHIIVCSNIK